MPRTKKTEDEKHGNRVQLRGMGQLYRREEGGNWYVSFSVNGKQFRETTHTAKYNDAVAHLKRRIAEIQSGQFTSVKTDKTTVGQILAEVIADYTVKKRDLTTFVLPLVNRHLLPYFEHMRASKVTVSHLRDYISKKQSESLSNATINRSLSLLRRAYTLGVAARMVNANSIPSFKEVRLAELNARQGFWSHEEYVKFRDALPGYARAPFIKAFWTGMRFGEIMSLEWQQVDFRGRAVRLADDQTKTSEPRIIPLGKSGLGDLYDMLVAQKELRDQLCPESKWVFFHTMPKFLGQNIGSLKAIWLKTAIELGMTKQAVDRKTKELKFHPDGTPVLKASKLFHDLRRTGVRNLVRAGVPEKVAMRISGHKTRSVFERYNIVDETDLHDAMDKLGRYVAGQAGGGN